MIGHYLKVILRIFSRQKVFMLINTSGLAAGFAAAILIFLFVKSEQGWDSFWPGIENAYRLETTFNFPGRPASPTAWVSAAAVDSLKEWYPEIETAAALWASSTPVRAGEVLYRERIMYAEPAFLDIFRLDFIRGGGKGPLDEMATILISESMAKKYFGDQDPLGQILTLRNEQEYKVTGVFRDLPEASHLELNMLARLNRVVVDQWFERWFTTNGFVYVKLKPGAEIDQLSARLPEFIDHYHAAQVTEMGLEIRPRDLTQFRFVPVPDIHLTSFSNGAIKPRGSQTLLTGLTIVGLFILGVAVINFINLSTARSSLRAREVGIRKMSGASRRQLAVQFTGEAMALAFLSLLIGVGVAEISLPFINDLIGKTLVSSPLYSGLGLVGLIVGGLGIGFVSGFYPALILSGARPVEVLFSNQSSAGPKAFFRSALVVVQFSIAIGMIFATVVLFLQTDYSRNFDLGYVKENKIILRGANRPEALAVREALVNALKTHPETVGVAFSRSVPGDSSHRGEAVYKTGVTNPTPIGISLQLGSPSFLKDYGAHILAGRLLSEERGQDILRRVDAEDWESQGNVVINEQAARVIGFSDPAEAIGERLKIDLFATGGPVDITVVGVVADMHFRSLHNQVRAAVFIWDEQSYRTMTISYKTGDLAAYLAFIDQTWENLVPGQPIAREFLDEKLEALYLNENRAYKLFIAGAILAVLISSLGLYGLALFAAERRIREISIRKVHGASILDIVRLLVWQFTLPVILANLVALPVAGWLMLEWLQSFTYRIDLSPGPFVLAGLLALFIAWITVGWHAVRAAQSNPAKNLHYE